MSIVPADTPHVAFRTALGYWLKLGFISFGGPAGQIAIMHAELVERRRWISERRFLHALNYCMLLPGPEAQQLATYIGWLLHGTWGGIVAGTLFVLPSVFILLALSWVYVRFGEVPLVESMFDGMKPAVVAVVAFAVMRIGSRTIQSAAALLLAAAGFAAMASHRVPFPAIVLAAGLLGYLGWRLWPDKVRSEGAHSAGGDPPPAGGTHAAAVIDDHHAVLPHTRPSRLRFAAHLTVGLLMWLAPMGLLAGWQGWTGTFTAMGWFFTRAALVTFGGAYAVLPYVSDHAVRVGWLQPAQMIDGLALGETTPGPLIMVVAFVGFVGGWKHSGMGPTGGVIGSLVATYFTFLPSFLFILLGAPFIEQMRGELRLTAALWGITAAVVGVVLHLAVFFAEHVFFATPGRVEWLALAVSTAAFVALWQFRVGIAYVVLASAAAGLAAHAVHAGF